MTQSLIKFYGWRGALLILSGILLNIVICGALFRPLVVRRRNRKPPVVNSDHRLLSQTTSDVQAGDDVFDPDAGPEPHRFLLKAQLENGCCIYLEPVTHSLIMFPTYLQNDFEIAAPHLCKDLNESGMSIEQVLRIHNMNADEFQVSPEDGTMDGAANNHDAKNRFVAGEARPVEKRTPCRISQDPSAGSRSIRQLVPPQTTPGLPVPQRLRRRQQVGRFRMTCRKDVFYRGSLLKAGFIQKERARSCPSLLPLPARSANDRLLRSRRTLAVRARRCFRDNFDVRIFRSVVFNYFCLHSLLLLSSYDIPYVFLPDKASTHGIGVAKASYLVSIIGICSTAGQVVVGYIGDLPEVNTLNFYNSMTSTAGIATLCVPWLGNFWLLAGYCVVYGFFISANFTLTTVILVDLLDIDKLSNAFGFVWLAEVFENLLGPPFADQYLQPGG